MIAVTPTPLATLSSAISFALEPAGAESNVAMFLASLGHRSAWISRVGDDVLGHRLVDAVAARGVDITGVQFVLDAPTGVLFKDPQPEGTKVFYYRRGSAASTMDTTMVSRLRETGAQVLHLSGITAALSDSCESLVDQLVVERALGADTQISFDVNYRPALWDSAGGAGRAIREIADNADVVFIGLDEAVRLWQVSNFEELRTVLPRPRMIVVKDSDREAVELGPDGPIHEPALKVEVLEPVGAGDAFAAGWLSGYLRGCTSSQRLALGHLVARSALMSTADVGQLPNPAEIAKEFGIVRHGRPPTPSGWVKNESREKNDH